MKSNKGFTLIELIAVIVILALLLVIAVPSILNARNKAILGLDKEQKRNIEEAGKMLGIDLDDYMTDLYNCKGDWPSVCNKNDDGKWTSVKVQIHELKEKGYFTDEIDKCSGDIVIIKDTNNMYTVNLEENVRCD